MSATTTLLLVVPGRRTLSLELSPRWPAAMIGILCVPLLMGAAARRCVDAWHGDGPVCRIAAHEVTGSLVASANSVPLLARPALRPAAVEVDAPMLVDAPMFTAIGPSRASRVVQPRVTSVAPAPARVPTPAPAPAIDGLSPGWLRVQALHLGESVRVRPFDADGAADPTAFQALSHLMRCRITGREIEIDPRLVRVLAQISAAYNKPIQLVSGHRQPHVIGTSSTSQHTLGKAADIRVAGVGVEELRDVAIKLGARGVGIYPEKGFVHIDVRDKKYLWVYTQADGETHYVP
jgi:uncharacterized protein YcbK (DUF882 family)